MLGIIVSDLERVRDSTAASFQLRNPFEVVQFLDTFTQSDIKRRASTGPLPAVSETQPLEEMRSPELQRPEPRPRSPQPPRRGSGGSSSPDRT
jgi:hypothetical protein